MNGAVRICDAGNVSIDASVSRRSGPRREATDETNANCVSRQTAMARGVADPAVLRDYLDQHRITRAREDELVFGRRGGTPFSRSTINQRAERAWAAADVAPVTLHECRHTFATLMIAAGVNAKALQTLWATRRSRSRSTATGTPSRAPRLRPRASSTPT